MNNNDFKKLLDNVFEPLQKDITHIKEELEIVREKSRKAESYQEIAAGQTRYIRDQISVINRKLDQHTESLVNIEEVMTSYKDSYKINNDNIRKMQHRVEVIEEAANIEPNPEYILVNVQ